MGVQRKLHHLREIRAEGTPRGQNRLIDEVDKQISRFFSLSSSHTARIKLYTGAGDVAKRIERLVSRTPPQVKHLTWTPRFQAPAAAWET